MPGFCVHSEYDTSGELLFPIRPRDKTTAFAGYTDQKASDKKVAHHDHGPEDVLGQEEKRLTCKQVEKLDFLR